MAFPTTAVLDNFDSYVVAGPPASSIWALGFGDSLADSADGAGHFGGNGAGFSGSYYVPLGSVTGDVEAYFTITTLPSNSLDVGPYLNYRATAAVGGGAPATSQNCYTLIVGGDGLTGWHWRLVKVGGGGATLIANTAVTLTIGDKFGISVVGTTHTVWYAPAATGIWAAIGTATDSSFTAGWLGLEFNTAAGAGKIDNFGGGVPVTGKSHTLAPSLTPKTWPTIAPTIS